MSIVTNRDIDNNNCIQQYRQFHVDISASCASIQLTLRLFGAI
jgi:hypothetical protein